jgi:hypothetical protein
MIHPKVSTPKQFLLEPMLCDSVERPPEGREWRYELKLDGFRLSRESGWPPPLKELRGVCQIAQHDFIRPRLNRVNTAIWVIRRGDEEHQQGDH